MNVEYYFIEENLVAQNNEQVHGSNQPKINTDLRKKRCTRCFISIAPENARKPSQVYWRWQGV